MIYIDDNDTCAFVHSVRCREVRKYLRIAIFWHYDGHSKIGRKLNEFDISEEEYE